MRTIDEIIQERKQQELENKTSQIQSNFYVSYPVSPDQASKQYDIAKSTNLPIGVVRAKENEILKRTELSTFNNEDWVNNFPAVANQLADIAKVPAIKDDLETLTNLEILSRSAKEKFQQSALQDQTVNPRLKRMGFEVTGSESFKLSPIEESDIATFDASQPKDYNLNWLESVVPETAGAVRTMYGMARNVLPKAGVGGAIGAVVGGGLTRTPAGAMAGLRAGGGYTATAAAGYEMAKLETAGAYDELRTVVDENGRPLEKNVAAGAAIATGVINGAIELIPVKVGLDSVKKAFSRAGIKQATKSPIIREYLGNIAKGVLVEGGTEGAQELFNIIAAESAKVFSDGDFKRLGMKDASDIEGLFKFVSDSASRIGQSAAAGSAGGGGIAVVGGGAIATKRIYDQRKVNEREQEVIGSILDTAKQSKVLNRSSKQFKDVTANTLGETNIYLPVDDFKTYFQDKPDKLASFYANAAIQDQIQEAVDTGGNIIIKANELSAAIKVDPELESLREFMKLTPESFTSLEAQDEFLQSVVPSYFQEENTRQERSDQDVVKQNIRQQLSNLGMPNEVAKQNIDLLTSFYDTQVKRYGAKDAKKIVDSYIGNIEANVQRFQKQPVNLNKIEDLDLMLDKARKPIKQLKAGKPLLKTLKEMGGVKLGSNLAGELKNLGITPKTYVGLFKKDGGIGDVDNIPASEFQAKFPNVSPEIEGDYISRQYLLDRLADEVGGQDISQAPNEEQRNIQAFLEGLDRAGIDITKSNEEIKKAIREFESQTFNQNVIPELKNLTEIANKSETADEFLTKVLEKNKKDFSNETLRNIETLNRNGFNIKSEDEIITLYHGTTARGFKGIEKDGFNINSYLASDKKASDNFSVGRGSKVIEIQIPISDLGFVAGGAMANAEGVTVITAMRIRKDQDGIYRISTKENPNKPIEGIGLPSSITPKDFFDKVKSGQTYFQTQTQTEAFKKWFGDSKVVDEKGEPLVVYHGMPELNKFNEDPIFKTANEQFGSEDKNRAYYFTDSLAKAKSYTDEKRAYDYQNAQGGVVETYLSIKNPLVVNAENKVWRQFQTEINGEKLVGTKQIVEYAKKNGFDGVVVKNVKDNYNNNEKSKAGDVYVAFEPTQIKSAIGNQGTFDPENPNIYKQGESAPQGQTQFLPNKPIITLFETADRSTLLHELGHVFLQIQADLSKLPNMPKQFQKDWAVIEKFLDIKNGKITREAHEKFARSFETYLREGKAPTVELREAFRKFKQWLTTIYENVLQLNVKINNDIRGVFDRMLATDEQIELNSDTPLFKVDTNILELLTKAERKDYLKRTEEAKEKTKEILLRKALKQKEKENSKAYKEDRSKAEAEVRDEMNKDKTFRALHFLKTGKLLGEDTELNPVKLNRKEIENYDGEFIKYLPKEIFGKNSAPVEMIAEEFGFKNGSEMLFALANAKDFNKELETATDAEMMRRYGNMLFDGSLEREALEASDSEAVANKIVYELDAVNRKVKSVTESKDAYKAKAREMFATKKIPDATDVNKYYINGLKAARETGKALGKKDYEKAVEWKKKQLLNHYLFQESSRFKKELAQANRSYKLIKRKPSKNKVLLDEEFREKALSLLQNFGLAEKPFDYKELDVNELEAWKAEKKSEEGILGLVEFPEIADFKTKDFNQLTTEEFRTLNDSIQNLAFVGRQERLIVIDGVKKSIDEFVDSVQENLDKIPDKQVKIGELSKKEKRKKFFDSAVSFLDKVQTTVFKIDDKQELGVFYQGFVKGLTEGERNKDNLSRESYAKLDEIFKKHYKKGIIPSKETYFETLNQSLTKKSVIALALNWGNQTNRKRIRDGYKWTDQQVNQILTTLDKNDLAFVQDIWDFINSYWPSLESIDKKIYGIAPKKEAASPITVNTKDGEVNLRGGYYPISYTEDTDLLETTAKELNSFFVNNQGSNLNVNKSYSKERATGRVQGKVDLTLNPLFRHLENVVNDIALKEPAWNAYKLVKNNKLKTQLKKKIGNADYQSLVSWVKDVYGKTSVQEGYLNKFARRARGATVLYQMGFKLSTVIIQATGLLNSTVKLGYGNMGYGIWKALGNGNPISINKAIREAEAKSKILKNRANSFNRDVSEIMQRMERSKGLMPDVAKYAFFAITSAQKMVDVPTWYGAYYKGFKEFKDDAKAVEYADKILESTQGTSHKYALSAIERNESGFAKIMTTFYSYVNVKLALLRQSYIGTDFKKPKDVAKFVNDMTLLFIADAIATEFLRRGISEALKDGDDEEEDKKKLTLKYLNLVGQSIVAPIPGVREVYSSATSDFSGGGMPAGLGIIDIVGKRGIGTIGKEILKEDEVDWVNVLRGVNNTSAVFSAGGGAQIDIFLGALQKQREGEEVAPIDFLLKSKK